MLILTMCFFSTVSFSQNLETVGAGVIDFLLSNPKTGDNMNETDKAALTVIGNLLKTAGKRKHDVNVANASANKQQIILNDNSGRQATVVLDPDGNIYILYNGVVYPINQSIVTQAKEEFVPKHKVENEYLPPYNLDEIESNFHFEDFKKKVYTGIEEEIWQYYKVENPNGEYMSNIAEKLDIPINKFEILYWAGRETRNKLNLMKRDEMIVKKGTVLKYKVLGFKYTVNNPDGEYMTDIANKLNVSVDDLEFEYYFDDTKKLSEYRKDFRKVKKKKVLTYLNSNYELFTNIPFLFTCKWARDFEDNGFEFDDFQGVKNSFSKNEQILFVIGCQTNLENSTYSFEIYEFSSSNLMFRRHGNVPVGQNIITEEITTQVLVPGGYLFCFKVKNKDVSLDSKTERFEIRSE